MYLRTVRRSQNKGLILLLPWFCFLFVTGACHTTKKAMETYGETSVKQLATFPDCHWIDHKPELSDTSALEKLKAQDWTNYSFRVYLGCWCSDSEHLIPIFRSLCDAAHIPETRVRYFNLDLDKVSPSGIEKQDRIEYLPTIIVLKNGKETGRIVETVKEDLASELLLIL
ncbi:MAG: hypothetical protein GC180_01035 [Bacteroidetes bacterium]|nr:hypothetical protein [Bacteroidota bacterium]